MRTITFTNDWTVHSPKKILESFPPSGKITLIIEWELCLYLARYDVNVWIRQIGPICLNSLVNIKYKIFAKKDFIQVDIAKSATYKLENQKRLGQTSIKLDKVVSSDGHLKLFCEIEMDCYNLNNNLPYTNIDMLNEEILTDFVIKVDDEVIKTHKCILAKNSKVFHRMFEQSGMTEAQNGEVILTDTTPECVRAMLKFFYTGMVSDEKMKSYVDGIFVISHKYQVEALKCLCEHFMCSNIDNESMVKCCEIINLYGAPTLEKACTEYIRFNGKSFLKSKEWEEIKNNYPNLFYRFLENIVENLGN
uniref:BTB domain-containing protein n=1 Tax=Meloidogyne enterolobii TaxID=390850 RepID=A0A6V7XNR3_MELEN|nr:unnamed protein product [Meloidogyne enterolobii]